MPYTAPPTFVDTNVLSAAQLNTLSDDIEFLNGLVSGANVAVNEVNSTATADYYYAFRYQHQYIHIKYIVTGTDGDYVKLWIYDDDNGWLLLFRDEPVAGDTTYTQAMDLTDTKTCVPGDTPGSQTGADIGGGGAGGAPNLTSGSWYELKLQYSNNGASGFRMAYIINADSTSL